ncbi:MAG: serine protein kinase RIO [Methanosphaera sp.]|nr:serine protein kinase RIO [Methanosphaera sp.]
MKDLSFEIEADKKMRKLEETKRLKSSEDRQVSSEVFDDKTLKVLYKLAKEGYIKSLNGVISTGKEANVFLGVDDDENYVAVKIYRVATLDFKKIKEYIAGDPRFKTHGNSTRKIVNTWTRKEFKNLNRLHNLGLRVPEPYTCLENVLVMEYLDNSDDDPSAAPPLTKVNLDNPEVVFEEIINFMDKCYNDAGLVHGDLSRYNILYSHNHPYVIDLSQATMTDHPAARSLLERDIKNIVYDASRFKLKLDYDDILNRIITK